MAMLEFDPCFAKVLEQKGQGLSRIENKGDNGKLIIKALFDDSSLYT